MGEEYDVLDTIKQEISEFSEHQQPNNQQRQFYNIRAPCSTFEASNVNSRIDELERRVSELTDDMLYWKNKCVKNETLLVEIQKLLKAKPIPLIQSKPIEVINLEAPKCLPPRPVPIPVIPQISQIPQNQCPKKTSLHRSFDATRITPSLIVGVQFHDGIMRDIDVGQAMIHAIEATRRPCDEQLVSKYATAIFRKIYGEENLLYYSGHGRSGIFTTVTPALTAAMNKLFCEGYDISGDAESDVRAASIQKNLDKVTENIFSNYRKRKMRMQGNQ